MLENHTITAIVPAYNEAPRLSKVLKVLKKHSIRKEDLDMIANFFSYAIIGCITQWAKEGMKTSPNEYNVNLHLITRECLEFIIMKYIA